MPLENILGYLLDAQSDLKVRQHFRHNDRNNDFIGSEDDENAIEEAAELIGKAITEYRQSKRERHEI